MKTYSFVWLLRNHPEAYASILASNGGDRAAAAENWQDLQEQIQETACKQAVKSERVRCMDHILLDLERGDKTLKTARAAVLAGTPGLQLPEVEPLHVGTSSDAGRALAQRIVSKALGDKSCGF